jgi:hypothetical protein
MVGTRNQTLSYCQSVLNRLRNAVCFRRYTSSSRTFENMDNRWYLCVCVCARARARLSVRPSRCGFASRSVRERHRLDVWSCLCMTHMKQREPLGRNWYTFLTAGRNSYFPVHSLLPFVVRVSLIFRWGEILYLGTAALLLSHCSSDPLCEMWYTWSSGEWLSEENRQWLTCRSANLSTTNTTWIVFGFNPGPWTEKPGEWPQLWHGQCLLHNEETAWRSDHDGERGMIMGCRVGVPPQWFFFLNLTGKPMTIVLPEHL